MEKPDQPSASRTPTEDDLVRLCRELNAHGVRYLVVGGFAIIQQGFLRATEDVDLLLEPSLENQKRLKKALLYLPDQAVRQFGDEDLTQFVVARVADDILVDLMFAACGIGYDEAIQEAEVRVLQEVPVSFASAKLLWRMKQTVREKDKLDRQWLREKLQLTEPIPPEADEIPWRKIAGCLAVLVVVLIGMLVAIITMGRH